MHDEMYRELVAGYLEDLRHELYVHGVPREQSVAVIAETEGHLLEAMSISQPQTVAQAQAVIDRFGTATNLAKTLGKEFSRRASRKRSLWPSLYLGIATLLLLNQLPFTGRIFGIWTGTIFLIASALGLACMGYYARRPLIGQFAAMAAALIAGCTVWFAATSVPVANGAPGKTEWFATTPRWNADRQIAAFNDSIAREYSIEGQLALGEKTFTNGNSSQTAPSELRYGARYWLPEGVREHLLGVKADEISPMCSTSSWKDAVAAWNGIEPGRSGRTGDWLIGQTSSNVARWEFSREYLRWMRDQPLAVQVGVDLRVASWPILLLSLLAGLATNSGWLAWLLGRWLAKSLRRIGGRSWAVG